MVWQQLCSHDCFTHCHEDVSSGAIFYRPFFGPHLDTLAKSMYLSIEDFDIYTLQKRNNRLRAMGRFD